jgi:16S rRNA (guanine966-N2)-methyltransferase
MMRVHGGRLKGRKIKAPPASPGVRPATALVRQAVFDTIGDVSECRVLDLYGGSGALAIEALSRGAERAVIVEKSRKNASIIKSNLAALDLIAKVICAPVEKVLSGMAGKTFDLIFVDPPFNKAMIEPTLAALVKYGLAGEAGLIVARHAAGEKFKLPQQFRGSVREKKYGDSFVIFLYF